MPRTPAPAACLNSCASPSDWSRRCGNNPNGPAPALTASAKWRRKCRSASSIMPDEHGPDLIRRWLEVVRELSDGELRYSPLCSV